MVGGRARGAGPLVTLGASRARRGGGSAWWAQRGDVNEADVTDGYVTNSDVTSSDVNNDLDNDDDVDVVTSYGRPSPESLAHAPPPGGVAAWLRGHGLPADVPAWAVRALVVATAGAALALAGANLAWVQGRLSDGGNTLLFATSRGTGPDLPGYLVIGVSLAAVAQAAATRARPSRWWAPLLLAALGATILLVALRARDQPGLLHDKLLAIPLFVSDTSGVHAHTWLGLGWWMTVAGGAVTAVAGVTTFAVLVLAGRRAR